MSWETSGMYDLTSVIAAFRHLENQAFSFMHKTVCSRYLRNLQHGKSRAIPQYHAIIGMKMDIVGVDQR